MTAVLIGLVRPGLSGEFTRKRVRRDTFFTSTNSKDQHHRLSSILQRLSDNRIISEQQIGDVVYLEFTHEILLRQWDLLHTLIEVRKERIEEREWLLPAAELWAQSQSTGRPKGDPSYLYRGDSLKRARRYIEDTRFGEDVDGNILACYRFSQQHQRRNLIRNIITGTILVIIIAISVFWLQGRVNEEQKRASEAQQRANTNEIQRATAAAHAQVANQLADQQTRIANARRLGEQALADIVAHPQRSLLLAVEAVQQTKRYGEVSVPVAEEALRQALANASGVGLGGHTGSVEHIAISPDNHWLVTGGSNSNNKEDGTVRLWDLTTKDPAAKPIVLNAHKFSVEAVAISSDSQWLITSGNDNTVRIWNLTSPNASMQPIELQNQAAPIAISADVHWLVTTNNNAVNLWDMTTINPQAKPIVLDRHKGDIVALAISSDSHWLATGDDKRITFLWDLTAPNPSTTPIALHGHHDSIRDIIFSADSQWLVTATKGSDVRLWHLSGDHPASSSLVLRGLNRDTQNVAISADNHWLAARSQDGTARVWDLRAANPNTKPLALSNISSFAFSTNNHWLALDNYLYDLTAPDPFAKPLTLHDVKRVLTIGANSHWLVSEAADHAVQLWDLTSAAPDTTAQILHGQEDWISVAAISANERWLAVGGNDTTARLWDLTAKEPGAGPSPQIFRRRSDYVTAVAISSKWLVGAGGANWTTQSHDGTAYVWNMTKPSDAPLVLNGHKEPITSLAISPDNHWLVTATGAGPYTDSNERRAVLWDLTSSDISSKPTVLEGTHSPVFISSDSHWLVAAGDTSAHLYDLTSSNHSSKFEVLHKNITTLAMSSNAKWLVICSENTAYLYDLTDGKPIEKAVLKGHEDIITSIAISNDNRWLVTASQDKTARLWDLTAPDPTAASIVLSGHDGAVTSVAISPNSHWLVTGSEDHTARLWNLVSSSPGSNPRILRGHEAPIFSIAISFDNEWIITGSVNETGFDADGTVRLWYLQGDSQTILSSRIIGHSGQPVDAIAVSPDKPLLVTGGADTTIHVWDLQLDDLIAQACHTAGRNLTLEEWRRVMGSMPYSLTCSNSIVDVNSSSRSISPSSQSLNTNVSAPTPVEVLTTIPVVTQTAVSTTSLSATAEPRIQQSSELTSDGKSTVELQIPTTVDQDPGVTLLRKQLIGTWIGQTGNIRGYILVFTAAGDEIASQNAISPQQRATYSILDSTHILTTPGGNKELVEVKIEGDTLILRGKDAPAAVIYKRGDH